MEFLQRCDLSPEDKERFAHRTADTLLKLDDDDDDERDRSRPLAVGDTWYRLISRAKSKVGRALISALVK
jgi:2,3-dihydroxybenzoate decarboxylase